MQMAVVLVRVRQAVRGLCQFPLDLKATAYASWMAYFGVPSVLSFRPLGCAVGLACIVLVLVTILMAL